MSIDLVFSNSMQRLSIIPIDSIGLLEMMNINDESGDNACQVDLNHDISTELLFYCPFDILSWAINGILTDTKRNLKQNRIQMTRKFSQTVHLSCLVVFCQFSTENVYEVEKEIMWFCIIWLYFWLPNVSFHDT